MFWSVSEYLGGYPAGGCCEGLLLVLMGPFSLAVTLGELPSGRILSSLPCTGEGGIEIKGDDTQVSVLKQASSLLALLGTRDQLHAPAGVSSRVWFE